MVLTRLAPVALLAGCLGQDRSLVEVPLAVRLSGDPPYVVGDASLDLQRAAFTLGDGLLRDDHGAVVGDWPHRLVVELVGGAATVDPARIYEGAVTAATVRIQGDPAVDLRGVFVLPGGRLVPFDFAPTLDLEPDVTVDVSPVDRGDVRPLDLVLDPAVALGGIDPSAPLSDAGRLEATGDTLDQLRQGLASPGAWSLVERSPTTP